LTQTIGPVPRPTLVRASRALQVFVIAAGLGALSLQTPAAAESPATAAKALTVASASTPVSTSFANLDPNDDYVVAPPAPREDCEAQLKAAGVKFAAARLPVHEVGKKRKILCGAEQVVTYYGSPAKIAWSPPPLLTCTMALALARFETILQEESAKQFGKPVVRIKQLGTYACREMANYPGWVSEHSYANAIDLETFVLKDGKEVTVLKHFERTDDRAKNKAGKMLQDSARRAYDENVFSTVLTPYFDSLHRNHFHLDLSRYRNDGTR
jgi:hypothetical protein